MVRKIPNKPAVTKASYLPGIRRNDVVINEANMDYRYDCGQVHVGMVFNFYV